MPESTPIQESGHLHQETKQAELGTSQTRGCGCANAVLLLALAFVLLACGIFALSRLETTVPGVRLVYSIDRSEDDGFRVEANQMVGPVEQRLHSAITGRAKANAISPDQIEVLLPTTDRFQIDRAMAFLFQTGVLRFAIIANSAQHPELIGIAESTADGPHRNVTNANGDVLGRWATLGLENADENGVQPFRVIPLMGIYRNGETGEILNLPNELRGVEEETRLSTWAKRESIDSIDVLTVVNAKWNVGAANMQYATLTYDQNQQPSIAFSLDEEGSKRFWQLTSSNVPRGQMKSQLGIVLDDQLLSAPNILAPIRTQGLITGQFSAKEVQDMVSILKAGQLPAKLSDMPLSETETTVSQSLLDRIFP